jgi:hypothetical protein
LLTSSTPSTCTAADLVDTQLWTYNLPANTLNEDGKAIRVTASFALGANANSKTVNFRVGGTTIGSRVTTQNGGATATVGTIIRTGAATETAYGDNSAGTGGTIVLLASDTTFPIVLTAWGQNGVATASDICLKTVTVELLQTTTNNIVTSTGGPVANPILLPNGTAGAPALTFASDTDSGLYSSGANQVSVALGGFEQIRFNNGANGLQLLYSGVTGARLFDDAADVLAQRRTTNPQTFRVYNTFTDASNYERGFVRFSSNVFEVGSEVAGTGTGRSMRLKSSGTGSIQFNTAAGDVWNFNSAGHLLANTDNTYDIGASGATRPRNLFLAGAINSPGGFFTSTGPVQVGSVAFASLPTCNAGARGEYMLITDSSVTTFLAAAAGGGASIVPVFCDGVSWKVG